MKILHAVSFGCALALAAVLAMHAGVQRSARAGAVAGATVPFASPVAADDDAALIAKGKERYQAYACRDCHGANGEGTEDAPDLVGTRLSAEQIAAFLNKPSADAKAKGMPDVPADSPDLKPLVAFVVSLKKAK